MIFWANSFGYGNRVRDIRDLLFLKYKNVHYNGATPKFGFKEGRPELGLDSSPGRIRQVVENSLKSLSKDYIDLLYQHRIVPKIPMEDVAGNVKVYHAVMYIG